MKHQVFFLLIVFPALVFARTEQIDSLKQRLRYGPKRDTVYPVMVVNGIPEEFPADKMLIGKGEKTDSFTLHTIPAVPGAMLYLYIDSYADQFGGPKGKKFKYRQLEELLAANAQESVGVQQARLEQAFVSWKGTLEQVDDVTVLGIRLQLTVLQ